MRLNSLTVVFLKLYYVIHDLDIYAYYYLTKTFKNQKQYHDSVYFRRVCKNSEVFVTQQTYYKYYRRRQQDFNRINSRAVLKRNKLFEACSPEKTKLSRVYKSIKFKSNPQKSSTLKDEVDHLQDQLKKRDS